MNKYTLRISIIDGDAYTKTIGARSLPFALKKAMDGLIPPRLRKDAYIEHVDGRIDPFHTPNWHVISGGKPFARIDLV